MYIIVFKTAFTYTFPFHFSSPHYACPEVIRVRDFFPKRHFLRQDYLVMVYLKMVLICFVLRSTKCYKMDYSVSFDRFIFKDYYMV